VRVVREKATKIPDDQMEDMRINLTGGGVEAAIAPHVGAGGNTGMINFLSSESEAEFDE
jgi:hypothetical protein